MQDCINCEHCDLDYIFDNETGEEFPLCVCEKGNDVSKYYECKDYECWKFKDDGK